jgi:conjugative transfer signal peptidase TraF
MVFGLAGLAILLALVRVNSPYRLLYNPSESAPRGWYAIVPIADLSIGELVVAQLPDDAATLAAQRSYLPRSIPVLKGVSAIGGQHVCLVDQALAVDGHVIVHVRGRDGAGRLLIPWRGCRALTAGEVLLLSTSNDASFDSRYFGPVQRSMLVGRAIPLWVWQ